MLKSAFSLYYAGDYDQCERTLRTYIQRQPKDAHALGLLAQVCFDRARLEQAKFFAERAVSADPRNIGALIVMARCHSIHARFDLALPLVRQASEIDPRSVQAWVARGHIAGSSRHYAESLDAYARALAIGPEEGAFQGLGQTWGAVAQYRKAAAVLAQGCAVKPHDPRLQAHLAFALVYTSEATPAQIVEAHREIGTRYARIPPLKMPALSPVIDPAKPLKVGLVSGDLHHHPVAMFMEPVLANRDAAQVEYIAYATKQTVDDTTRRLKPMFSQWRELTGMNESESCALIMKDQPDVLIDLAGHTLASGVWLFRNRLAPVQATYLGYPATTGIRGVDYRLVDVHTDPPGYEPHSTEQLIRMDPCMHCYVPPHNAPAPRDPSARAPGPICFGSFNFAGKLSTHTLDLWSAILKAVPGSTLHLKSNSMATSETWQYVLVEFAARQIGPERVHALPRTESFGEHLAQYDTIDLALDPTPYNGTTTTCECLYMGVPVVACWGDRHSARVSGSLLSAAGVPELVTPNASEYVQLAVALAGDRSRLAHYRATLRSTLLASTLCNGPGMARRFEGALRHMWRLFCTWGVAR